MFLIADGYAMCSSMLVLFCIIWSMVCKHEKSSLLIDRSLVLLKQSLYGTLLVFTIGVYIIIHHKSLWAAIIIFVMCSQVVVTTNRSILHVVIPKLIPADDRDYLQWLCCWKKYDLLKFENICPLKIMHCWQNLYSNPSIHENYLLLVLYA